MVSLNRCEFIGNLGAKPEIKTLQNGNRVANMSLACSESWKDKTTGEKKERTEWVRVTIYQEGLVKVAEQYLQKGSKIFIEGQMQTRKYQKDGQDHYATEIVLQGFNSRLIMLDGRRDGDQQNSAPAQQQQSSAPQSTIDEDTIPF